MLSLTRTIPAVFVVLWATGFIGARYAMPWMEPFTFIAVRIVLSITLLMVLIPFFKAKRLSPMTAVHAAIAGALMHGVYLGGIFWAVRHGLPAGFAGLVVGLQPLLTALIAGAFARENVDRRLWTGLIIGFTGVAIVISPKLGDVTGGVTPATIAAGLAAVVCMSLGTVWQKKFVANADLLTGTIWQYVGGLFIALPISFLFETREYVLTGELVFAMAWLVIVLSVSAVLLLMVLIRAGEVSRVASLFYLVPAVTALMAWLLFNETLNAVQLVGMAVTTLGVALATVQADRRKRDTR